MRRGLERYAPKSGYDMGPLGRQRMAQVVVQKAGLFPGDWVIDVETRNGILGVQVARAFTRSKMVLTAWEREDLLDAAKNAEAEGCRDRVRLVQCLPDELPFKDESFFFATVGPQLAVEEEPLDVLDELHRVTFFSGKVYAPSLDFRKARVPLPAGAKAWVFDEETVKAMKEMGFGKVATQRVMLLPDGALLQLVMAKRYDPEGDEDEAEVED